MNIRAAAGGPAPASRPSIPLCAEPTPPLLPPGRPASPLPGAPALPPADGPGLTAHAPPGEVPLSGRLRCQAGEGRLGDRGSEKGQGPDFPKSPSSSGRLSPLLSAAHIPLGVAISGFWTDGETEASLGRPNAGVGSPSVLASGLEERKEGRPR